jgi:spore germination protein YaaH
MFTLILSRTTFIRVRKGVKSCDIERVYLCPRPADLFEGQILQLPKKPMCMYRVGAGESYLSIADKFSVSEEEIKRVNGDKQLYPTCKIYIP